MRAVAVTRVWDCNDFWEFYEYVRNYGIQCAYKLLYTLCKYVDFHSHTNFDIQYTPHFIAQRCRSKKEKFILEDLFSSVLSQIKKISPLLKPEI